MQNDDEMGGFAPKGIYVLREPETIVRNDGPKSELTLVINMGPRDKEALARIKALLNSAPGRRAIHRIAAGR